MNTINQSLNRILAIFSITYREAIRRKLVWIFVGSCVFFSLSGACTAKFIATKIAQSEERPLPEKADYMREARQFYEQNGLSGKALENRLEQEEARYEVLKQNHSPKALAERRKKTAAISEMIVVGLCFLLFATWSYLLAALFTPFITLSDLQTGAHVLLLASPLQRFEYLSGKFLAILGMLATSLFLMLLTFHLGMFLLYEHPGLVIWRSLPLLLFGLGLFIVLILFLSLILGRMPALLLSLAILFFSSIAAIPLLSSTATDASARDFLVYTGYVLPQFGVNGLTALLYAIGPYEGAQAILDKAGLNIFKIGAKLHYYSMLINLAWFLLLSGLAGFIFQRRDLDV